MKGEHVILKDLPLTFILCTYGELFFISGIKKDKIMDDK